jgi:hypothetical protein
MRRRPSQGFAAHAGDYGLLAGNNEHLLIFRLLREARLYAAWLFVGATLVVALLRQARCHGGGRWPWAA